MEILHDQAAERAVLAGICNYGTNAYLDIADIISVDSFTIDSNQIIFKCIKNILDKSEVKSIDVASIYSSASEIGLTHFIQKKEENKHLNAILSLQVNPDNVRRFAAKIRKLQIIRLLHQQLEYSQDKLLNLTGTETVTQILGIAEDSIFNFSSLINDVDKGPQPLLIDIEEHLKYLSDNPVEQIGISTGYPVYDRSIGGGLRSGVSVIGARMKVGKSQLCLNIGVHISKNLNIPVLYMDTEMDIDEQKNRCMALLSSVDINNIETGKFGNNKDKLFDVAKQNTKIPFYHKQISGVPFEEQLAIMRRWVVKDVGLNNDGKAKKCVILYDYLKLMSSESITDDLKEYQILGFMMTSLHNFSKRYDVPMLSTIQLNRDGITKESTDVVGASDRVGMYCNNFSIYKVKSDEEIAEDGQKHGNRKLVPIICRHGKGLDQNDYINMYMRGEYSQIIEGKTKLEIQNQRRIENEKGFIVDESNNDEIPFE